MTTSLLDPEVMVDPYPFYREIQHTPGIHHDPRLNAWLISRYDAVRSALSQDTLFTTAPLATRAEPVMRGRVLAQMTGSEHALKMAAIMKGISGRILTERYAPLIEKLATRLLNDAMSQDHFDLVTDFGRRFAVLATLTILGIDEEYAQQIRGWHDGITHYVTSLVSTEDERRHDIACSEHLEQFLLPFIHERRHHPDTDLLSLLCQTSNGGMTDSEVVALAINILLAATEPSDKTLTYLTYHLLTHGPDATASAHQDQAYLQDCIAETLRLHSPVQLIPRQTAQDTILDGTLIPAGETVFCLIGAANRDAAVFDHPTEFRPHRHGSGGARPFTAAAHHLAFGHGLHFCIGAAFARMQLTTAAAVLAAHLPHLRLDGNLAESGLYTRGPITLPLSHR
ncbi:Pulcherriminic acid synthase [Austwickia sp. TVS 96-490-7B]|uniref:cytochrome P450 n=1 Tax=Austwickia sp. TVS 96-490-7B TaxID=2830843 RepID=UPI001C55D046|nr:cytochrome P450 [Austwickia sp. TVS 96-490-7B]MBW3084859.1 Pulcherriminic acid synthase [Austwickia sp. TVS 96-490-7B]